MANAPGEARIPRRQDHLRRRPCSPLSRAGRCAPVSARQPRGGVRRAGAVRELLEADGSPGTKARLVGGSFRPNAGRRCAKPHRQGREPRPMLSRRTASGTCRSTPVRPAPRCRGRCRGPSLPSRSLMPSCHFDDHRRGQDGTGAQFPPNRSAWRG